jgi:hypothetical protein
MPLPRIFVAVPEPFCILNGRQVFVSVEAIVILFVPGVNVTFVPARKLRVFSAVGLYVTTAVPLA